MKQRRTTFAAARNEGAARPLVGIVCEVGQMWTVQTQRSRARGHVEISAGTFLIVLVLGLVLVCASSRNAATE